MTRECNFVDNVCKKTVERYNDTKIEFSYYLKCKVTEFESLNSRVVTFPLELKSMHR